MRKQNVPILKRIFYSRYLSYLLILILIFSLISLGREVSNRLSLKKQLSRTENQVKEIETENQKFLEEIESMQTEYFKEKAARLKLGLQKPGEHMIVIVQNDNNFFENESKIKYFDKKISNFKTWWSHFFTP